MLVLLLLYAVVMAVATFVESKYSTLTARLYFYNSWWFMLLQGAMVVNFVAVSLKFKLFQQRKWGVLISHYALVLILLGAMVTHFVGREGIMHIREGESSNKIYSNDGQVVGELPFTVTLKDFRLVRYPGSGSPSSFESDVVIEGVPQKIYMNNIVYKDGYRLYQASYDHDEKGTVLSVNQDALGTVITYIGYLLLVLGLLLSLVHRNSHFRTLIRSLSVVALIFMSQTLFAQSQEMEQPVQQQIEQPESPEQKSGQPQRQTPAEGALAVEYAQRSVPVSGIADEFGKLLVQTQGGRIEPVDTYAGKMLRKLARQKSFEGMSANQVLLGIITNPEVWSRVPIIYDGSQMIAFVDVLDNEGQYLYAKQVEQIYEKPVAERNKKDKEILKLDEKVNIIHALFSGEMLPIFPNAADPTHKWYSPGDDIAAFQGADSMFVSRIFVWFANEVRKDVASPKALEIVGMIDTYQHAKSNGIAMDKDKIEAEVFYNKADVFKWSAFSYMGLGLLTLILLVVGLLRDSRPLRIVVNVLVGLIVAVFLWHSFGIGLRWYIAGRAPMSNAYETMVYVGWAAAFAGLLFIRRSRMTMALGAFFAGVLLFVSNLNFMDPEITPLVPVLKSYWLMIHVAVITGSYGFFGIGFLIGLVTVILMVIGGDKFTKQVHELYVINQLALTVGLVLLTAGTFLGAVWANESWGRYWGWDPKETWALISMITYTIILHARFIPQLRSAYAFSVMSIVGLASILMTFFGVNYYLSGLHSYGSDSAPPALNIIYVVYGVILVFVGWAYFKIRKK